MPRKNSQAAKKDAVETKNEGITPRRSGRASTTAKQELNDVKDPSRSRRSSTAAQTVASVAESKSTKGKTRRESTSPSDSRTRSGKDGAESATTRVKSTRRSTGRVNYRESDGEEETAPAPKYDDNFESADEFDDSESDEKSKPRGRNKQTKTPTKGRGSKEKTAGGSRGRRGRPSKKKSELPKALDISEDSMEPEVIETKPAKTSSSRSSRGRKSKTEVVDVELESKAKPSRRSARSSSIKDETPKKRPSRSVQAKKYTEDDDEDIEEISDSKVEEMDDSKVEEVDVSNDEKSKTSRKRKRSFSTEEPSKRIKDVEDEEKESVSEEKKVQEKSVVETMEEEEAMEVDTGSDIVSKTEKDLKDHDKKNESTNEEDNMDTSACAEDKKDECDVEEKEDAFAKDKTDVSAVEDEKEKATSVEDKKEIITSVEDKKEIATSAEDKKEITTSVEDKKIAAENKKMIESESGNINESDKKSIDKSETVDKIVDDNQASKIKTKHTPSEKEESQETKDSKGEGLVGQKSSVEESANQNKCVESFQTPEKVQVVSCPVESKMAEPSNVDSGQEPAKMKVIESKELNNIGVHPNDLSSNNNESESSVINVPRSLLSQTNVQSTIVRSDPTLNGAEKHSNSSSSATGAQVASVNSDHIECSVPRANGAHEEVHNDSTLSKDKAVSPGRRFVLNPKLSENVLPSIKNKTFGFLSCNLGSDVCVQKEKLLKELQELNSHIVCLQQVPKIFYSSVLEPSLDALGYKGVFSQPFDSLKGLATFFKNSQFKLSEVKEISLKQLVDKELETSLLEPASKAAVQSYVKRCGSALLTHFTSIIGTQSVIVVNVQIPPSDLSAHALQVSCLAREIIRINGGTNKPLLIGGEFNISENDASYQLLRDGYLSNDMIDELQRRKDIVVLEKEKSSLVDLLWKSFQHPSSNLCSCYVSVLNHELLIPELKKASPDLLWYSSDSLLTVGVVDAESEKADSSHISLKADIAFSN